MSVATLVQIPDTIPQQYHESYEDADKATWVKYEGKTPSEEMCRCTETCAPETCARFTLKCDECEEWISSEAYIAMKDAQSAEPGFIACQDCVDVVEVMSKDEGDEFFGGAYGGYTVVFYKYSERYGRKSGEPSYDDPYCAECAKHEHYRNGTRYSRSGLEEGQPEECGDCSKKMYPDYAWPDCPICGGEGDVKLKGLGDGTIDCPECQGGDPGGHEVIRDPKAIEREEKEEEQTRQFLARQK